MQHADSPTRTCIRVGIDSLASQKRPGRAISTSLSSFPHLNGRQLIPGWHCRQDRRRNLGSPLQHRAQNVLLDRMKPVPVFDACSADYIKQHRNRHNALLAADVDHFLSSPQQFMSNILSGLPNTIKCQLITKRFESLSSEEQTAAKITEICSKIATLPHRPPCSTRNVNGMKRGSLGSIKYKSKPFDSSISDYKCETCKMDSHDERSGERKKRVTAKPKQAAKAAAASNNSLETLSNAAAVLIDLFTNSPDVKGDSNYPPALDTAATHHIRRERSNFTSINPIGIAISLANETGAYTLKAAVQSRLDTQ